MENGKLATLIALDFFIVAISVGIMDAFHSPLFPGFVLGSIIAGTVHVVLAKSMKKKAH